MDVGAGSEGGQAEYRTADDGESTPQSTAHSHERSLQKKTQTLPQPAHRYCGDTTGTGIAPCRAADLSNLAQAPRPKLRYSLRAVDRHVAATAHYHGDIQQILVAARCAAAAEAMGSPIRQAILDVAPLPTSCGQVA